MKVRLCDLCHNKIIGGDGDIKIKYRAKKKWCLWYEEGWNNIDICSNCVKRIISAIGKDNNEDK